MIKPLLPGFLASIFTGVVCGHYNVSLVITIAAVVIVTLIAWSITAMVMIANELD